MGKNTTFRKIAACTSIVLSEEVSLVVELLRLSSRFPRDFVEVPMNGKEYISALPHEGERIIFTRHLGGCIGVLLFHEKEDGERLAFMTHRSVTLSGEFDLSAYGKLLDAHPLDSQSDNSTLLIMMPSKASPWGETEQIIHWHRERMGPGVRIAVVPFISDWSDLTRPPHGRFLVCHLRSRSQRQAYAEFTTRPGVIVRYPL